MGRCGLPWCCNSLGDHFFHGLWLLLLPLQRSYIHAGICMGCWLLKFSNCFYWYFFVWPKVLIDALETELGNGHRFSEELRSQVVKGYVETELSNTISFHFLFSQYCWSSVCLTFSNLMLLLNLWVAETPKLILCGRAWRRLCCRAGTMWGALHGKGYVLRHVWSSFDESFTHPLCSWSLQGLYVLS
jgi:hypothetical protein